MPTNLWRTIAVMTGVMLVAAPAAHAGWTAPSPLRGNVPTTHAGSAIAVAVGPDSRGAVIAQRPTPGDAGAISQGDVRRARALPLRDVLAGSATAFTVSPGGAAALAVRSPAGYAGWFRDGGGPFGAPVALGTFDTQPLTATNARGDSVMAAAVPTSPGATAVVFVARPARGAPGPPIVVSEAGAVGLFDVAIGDRGHIAVAWHRNGVLEARVREPAGALSPVGQFAAGSQVGDVRIAADNRGITDLAAIVPIPAAPGASARAVIVARRPAGGAFSGIAVLDSGPDLESLEAVAAGRSALLTWLRTTAGPTPLSCTLPPGAAGASASRARVCSRRSAADHRSTRRRAMASPRPPAGARSSRGTTATGGRA